MSRLPDLYRLKPAFVAALDPLTERLARRGVHPDRVTDAGTALGLAGGAALAAGTVAPVAWFAVLPLQVARLAANAIDGRLARTTGASSAGGAVRNELSDRLGDLALLGGLAVVTPAAGATALVAVLLSEWAATLGWAVTGERRFVGPGGKPDRAVLVGLAAALAPLVGTTELAWTAWAVALLAVVATVRRLRAAAPMAEVAR